MTAAHELPRDLPAFLAAGGDLVQEQGPADCQSVGAD
jgi:hypothetical protein